MAHVPRRVSCRHHGVTTLAVVVLLTGPVVTMNYLLGEPYAPIRERAWSISLIFAALTVAVGLGIIESTVGQGSTVRVWVPNIALANTTPTAITKRARRLPAP